MKIFYNHKVNLFNLINLDKPNPKYLVPISPILFSNYFSNHNYKLYNLINLDKPNPKYLIPISPIQLEKYFMNII